MISHKNTSLKPLLESAQGIHVTGYLVNRSDLSDLKQQLCAIMDEAYEVLHPVMSLEQRNRFFEPLDALLHDARIFKKMTGNIGVFRTEGSFRVLNLPVDVQQFCAVASTFHVKPLLRWMQTGREVLQAIVEFRLAREMNLAEKNIFDIARAAVQGRVRKLIVTDGIKIFGQLDQKTGELTIHPFDLDHEDDDLLDDLAQTVFTQGGKVIVASRKEMPEDRPAIAILDHEYEDLGGLEERRAV